MSKKGDTRFLYLLIENQFEDNSGFYLSCLAQNDRIDESRFKIEERLKPEGIVKCRIAEVGIVDSSEIDMSQYEDCNTNNTRLGLKRYEFGNTDDYNFINPLGVVISAHSPIDRDGISLSYSLIRDDYSTFAVEIVPDIDTIEQTIGIICSEIISELNFLGVYLDGQYDNNGTDYNAIWVKTGVDTQLLGFVMCNKLNLLENGFLTIELGNQFSNNRVRITKTKELIFWTDSSNQFEELKSRLNDLGYLYKKEIVSTGKYFEHFKYRKKGSLDMENLVDFMIDNDFKEHKFE